MEGDQNESDVEQNESHNKYSCETSRKMLNTNLDAMTLYLHGVGTLDTPFTWCCSTVRLQLQKINLTELLKYYKHHYQMLMLWVLVNLLALNLLMLFLKLSKRQQSLIICKISWKRSWLLLHTLKRYKFWHLHQIHGPVDTVQNILMFQNTKRELQGNLKRLKEFLRILHKNKEKWYPKIPLTLCLACIRIMS